MHLSGISTYTKNLKDKLEGTNIKLADTRKTTPGLRIFEKYAFNAEVESIIEWDYTMQL